MPVLDLIGPVARDAERRSRGTSRLVNMFREAGERSAYVCRGVPGMHRHATLDGLMARALVREGDTLLAVHGGALWRVQMDGTRARLMDVPDAPNTRVLPLEGAIAISANGTYRIRNADGTVTMPTLPADLGGETFVPADIATLGRRIILLSEGGRSFAWSAPGNPASVDALAFATTEQRDGPNLRVIVVGAEVWFFKRDCIERWYLTGEAQPAFAYLPGSLIETGVASAALVADTPFGAFFVSGDGRAYIASGGSVRPVSNVPVETAIAAETPTGVLHTRFEGHEFACILFRDRPAWCLDVATGEWFERAEGDSLGPWSARFAAEVGQRRFCVTDRGALMEFKPRPEDDGEPLHRVVTGRSLINAGQRFRITRMEVQATVGQADASSGAAPRREPAILLSVSEDGGQSFSAGRARTLGGRGETTTRAEWRALGQFRSFTPRLSVADPVDVTIDASAFVEIA